jgi:nucleotide-binding universal stress UspA family protein
MYEKILVPVDGSDPSNCGVLEAIKLAKVFDAQIRLLHVDDEPVLDANCIGMSAGDVSESFRTAGRKVLHDGAALVRQFGLVPEAVSIYSLGASTASLIAAHAEQWRAALIIMGTHGRHGLKRLAMGSEAEDVVRKTRVPVLLIHDGSENTPEAQRGEPAAVSMNQTVYA